MIPPEMQALSTMLAKLAEECHARARSNGFWRTRPEDGDPESVLEVATKLALITAEVAEAIEAWRLPDPFAPCPKDPRLSIMSEELADIIIRTVELAYALRINIGEATAIKMSVNATRPYKHGKRF